MTFTATVRRATRGNNDIHNITADVASSVSRSGVSSGIVTVFVPGSTASVTTIEYEPGAVEDLRDAIERLAPVTLQYRHDARWGDGNGYAHVRAALLGPSLSIPLRDNELQLGTWQQIILVDFDNRPRNREVIVQIVGDTSGA